MRKRILAFRLAGPLLMAVSLLLPIAERRDGTPYAFVRAAWSTDLAIPAGLLVLMVATVLACPPLAAVLAVAWLAGVAWFLWLGWNRLLLPWAFAAAAAGGGLVLCVSLAEWRRRLAARTTN